MIRAARNITIRFVVALSLLSPSGCVPKQNLAPSGPGIHLTTGAPSSAPPRENIITRAAILKIDPGHKGNLEGADGCTDCHETAQSSGKTPKPWEISAPFFSHKTHEDNACQECHPAKEGTEFLPSKANCKPCHADEIEKHSETGTRCTSCHARKPGENTGHNPLQPKHGRIKPFNINCASCHDIKDGKQITTKGVENCVDCHGMTNKVYGKPNPADFSHQKHGKETCTACHDAKQTGKITPPKLEACVTCHPKNHTPEKQPKDTGLCFKCHAIAKEIIPHTGSNWATDHGKANKESCAGCHGGATKNMACADCHTPLSQSPHQRENNFLYTHPAKAQAGIVDCRSCHDSIKTNQKSVCASCHTAFKRIGKGAMAHADNHARAARQNPESCASCHGEMGTMCWSCHPGGINK